jgi:hypothetical protein
VLALGGSEPLQNDKDDKESSRIYIKFQLKTTT